MSTRPLPPQPSLEHLKNQAKDLLKAHKSSDPEAAPRLRKSLPRFSESSDEQILGSTLSLRDAQTVIAHEYGFDSYVDLRQHVTQLQNAPLVDMEVVGIRTSIDTFQNVVVLRIGDSDRYLPIWIGPTEADAIARLKQGVDLPRPLTHDLFGSTISDLGARVARIVISDLRNTTFYATISLEMNGSTVERDARPSDAIALAIGAGAPVLASELVAKEAGVEWTEGEPLHLISSQHSVATAVVAGSVSEQVRGAILSARSEAVRLSHDSVGVDHLLLGLLSQMTKVVAKVFKRLQVNPNEVAGAVEARMARGKATTERKPPLSPDTARVIALAGDEARGLGSYSLGNEHLLIAILKEGEGNAVAVLKEHSVTSDAVEAELRRLHEEWSSRL